MGRRGNGPEASKHLDNPWGLTRTEVEVMAYRCLYPMRGIADHMQITYATVNDHLKNIHQRMGIRRGHWACVLFDRWRCKLWDEFLDVEHTQDEIKAMREALWLHLE